MSRDKGQRGEREFLKLLEKELPIKLERNLDQTRDGGCDLLGIKELAIEVKRCETLCINNWWEQALEQAGKDQYPVLAYRQSRKPWQVMIPLSLLAPKEKWQDETAVVTVDVFIKIIKKKFFNKNTTKAVANKR